MSLENSERVWKVSIEREIVILSKFRKALEIVLDNYERVLINKIRLKEF